MVKGKLQYMLLTIGMCLCMALLFPTVATAEDEATIGGENFEGAIGETAIHDTVLEEGEILANYQAATFITNITITDENDTDSTKCVLNGKCLGKLTFDLISEVDALKIGLNLPQSITVSVDNIKKDNEEFTYADNEVVVENGILTIDKAGETLKTGNYVIDMLIEHNNVLNLSIEFVSDTVSEVGYESDPLQVEVVELPNLL
ncbi:MAG: hypothetical protein PHI90_10905 [Clostridia bacterium]|nr:hypothetical protein [Clostridia bacterium]MDD4049298.1 hypothetical protein [Clostridia bacterium]